MHSLRISEDNFIKAQQSRASAEITCGLESEISACHDLSLGKRSIEFLFFAGLYLTGAFLALGVSGIWLLLPVILMGVAMNSLGIFLHEGLHGLLAENETTNHFLSFLVGLPILLSPTAYQFTHNNHHYDLGRKLDYGTYSQHLKNPSLVWAAYMLQLLFGSFIYVLVIPVISWIQSSKQVRIWIAVEYVLIITMVITAYFLIPFTHLLCLWLAPLLVVNVLSNIRGLASHALGEPEDIYLSSRSVDCPAWISTLFLHENFHVEHHLFPRVPSYHLKQLHGLLWNRLPRALSSRSYFHFLFQFFKSAGQRSLKPQGICFPASAKKSS